MRYMLPKTQTLSMEHNGTIYSKSYYLSPVISGFTDENYRSYTTLATTPASVGEFVIVPELRRIYRSAIDNNQAFPPSDTAAWIDYGPTNSFKMLASDEFLGAKSIGENVVLEFAFNRMDTFAAIYVDFNSALVEQIENGAVISTETIRGYRGCLSFSEYFYGGKKPRRRFVRSDFKWRPASTLRITFSGAVEIGTLVCGKSAELGATIYGGALEYESESKFTIDEISGYRSVLRYGSVRVMDATIAFDTNSFNTLANTAEEIIDRNVLWIPTEQDRFSEAITIGYIERFRIPMEKTKMTQTQTRIIGGY